MLWDAGWREMVWRCQMVKSGAGGAVLFDVHGQLTKRLHGNSTVRDTTWHYIKRRFVRSCPSILARLTTHVNFIFRRTKGDTWERCYAFNINIACGDMNVRLYRPDDVWTIRFTDMLTSFGLKQWVNQRIWQKWYSWRCHHQNWHSTAVHQGYRCQPVRSPLAPFLMVTRARDYHTSVRNHLSPYMKKF